MIFVKALNIDFSILVEEQYTVCSLGEVKKFLLISWAWKVCGSSGGWQTFNDTWTFDKYMLHFASVDFYVYFFCHQLNFEILTF